jgi:uncharacterized protein YbcC (UPF0753/DUF2309 family)
MQWCYREWQMSPFVLILVFKLGAGSLAIDMPNGVTCEGAAQFSKGQDSVSAAFCIDRRSQFYRRDKSKP